MPAHRKKRHYWEWTDTGYQIRRRKVMLFMSKFRVSPEAFLSDQLTEEGIANWREPGKYADLMDHGMCPRKRHEKCRKPTHSYCGWCTKHAMPMLVCPCSGPECTP